MIKAEWTIQWIAEMSIIVYKIDTWKMLHEKKAVLCFVVKLQVNYTSLSAFWLNILKALT